MRLPLLTVLIQLFLCCAADAGEAPARDPYGDPLPPGAVARLGTVRLRHPGGSIASLVYTSDGKGILSAGTGRHIVLWELADGKEKRRWTFEGPSVKRIVLSPDGKLLAAAGGMRLMLWSMDGEKPALSFEGEGPIEHLAFADGGKALVAMEDQDHKKDDPGQVLHRWDSTSGKELSARRLDRGRTWLLTPDGKFAWVSYGGSAKSKVRGKSGQVVNVEDGTESPWPEELPSGLKSISSDGKFLAGLGSGQKGKLYEAPWVWDLEAGNVSFKPYSTFFSKADEIVVSPGGQRCLLMGYKSPESKGGTFVIDVVHVGAKGGTGAKHSIKTSLDRGGETRIRAWAFSPDGETLAVGNRMAIDLFDLKTGKLKELPGAMAAVGPASRIAFSPDGKVAGALCYTGITHLYDASTGELLKKIGDRATCFGFSSDGKLLATADAYGRGKNGDVHPIRVWNIDDGKSLAKIVDYYERFSLIRFVDNDRKIAAANSKFLGVFDWSKEKLVGNTGPSGFFNARLHQDGMGGSWFLRDGVIARWDPVKMRGADTGLSRADAEDVWEMTCNGKTLVVLDATRNCFRVWDLEKKQWTLPVLPVHAGIVLSEPTDDGKYKKISGGSLFHMTDDGCFLATASRKSALAKQVDKTDKKGKPAPGKTAAMFGELTEDGTEPATGQVRIWDLSTGREIARLEAGPLKVVAMALTRDGKRLLTAHSNAAPLIWDLDKFANPKPLPTVERKAEELNLLWLGLVKHDEIQANLDEWSLVRAGAPAAKLIADRLLAKPVEAAAEKIAQWAKDLDDADEDVRLRACLELSNQPVSTKTAIFKATGNLKTNPGRKLYWEMVKVLNQPDPTRVRTRRALEALELMSTREALAALTRVAESDVAALAEPARAAAARVEKRLP